jgi:hypothetical protein
MGLYDGIAIPIQGQPLSSSNFGSRVRDAILDLDRRISSLDTSNNTGRAYSTSSLVLNNTTETAGLTILGMVFKAGLAYQAEWKGGVIAGASGNTVVTRVRKYNATPGSGADWGDLYRTEGLVGSTRAAGGTLYLLNGTTSDVTSDVNLNHISSSASASGITIAGSANSPRWFTIKPVGFAADFAGMGVQVS